MGLLAAQRRWRERRQGEYEYTTIQSTGEAGEAAVDRLMDDGWEFVRSQPLIIEGTTWGTSHLLKRRRTAH